ncbi:hypothetical protein ABTZ46_25215 [Nocardioides sp. NPDC126508]
MTDNSDGLIRSALRGNEETASRLRRTQFLGVLILAVATLAVPVVAGTDDSEVSLSIWAASGWVADLRDASGEVPAAYVFLAFASYAGILFALAAPVLGLVIALQRSGAGATRRRRRGGRRGGRHARDLAECGGRGAR